MGGWLIIGFFFPIPSRAPSRATLRFLGWGDLVLVRSKNPTHHDDDGV
jgi:hypothetical protein